MAFNPKCKEAAALDKSNSSLNLRCLLPQHPISSILPILSTYSSSCPEITKSMFSNSSREAKKVASLESKSISWKHQIMILSLMITWTCRWLLAKMEKIWSSRCSSQCSQNHILMFRKKCCWLFRRITNAEPQAVSLCRVSQFNMMTTWGTNISSNLELRRIMMNRFRLSQTIFGNQQETSLALWDKVASKWVLASAKKTST